MKILFLIFGFLSLKNLSRQICSPIKSTSYHIHKEIDPSLKTLPVTVFPANIIFGRKGGTWRRSDAIYDWHIMTIIFCQEMCNVQICCREKYAKIWCRYLFYFRIYSRIQQGRFDTHPPNGARVKWLCLRNYYGGRARHTRLWFKY